MGHTSLNISDPKLWKPMDSSRIVSPGKGRTRNRTVGEVRCYSICINGRCYLDKRLVLSEQNTKHMDYP